MIDKVGKSCTGCGACEARCPFDAITFKEGNNSFVYPAINPDKCTKCNLCERVCPTLVNLDNLQHKYVYSYAASLAKKPVEASSGGGFYSIAKSTIAAGGVVYGALMSPDMTVRHSRIDDVSSLHGLCGSKYVQSIIAPDIFKRIESDLKDGIQVLFSGTPCQVAGLRLYLRKDFENLYTIDLVCHGVPSPAIFADYIKYCSKLRRRAVSSFLCRDNRHGWNNIFKSTIMYANGKEEYNTGLANLWNRIFFSELITRPSCHECRFTRTERIGDLTLGDFWGIETVPEDVKRKGVSLILCNTEKGRFLLSNTELNLIESETNIKEHPNLYRPTTANPRSSEFMQYYHENGFSKAIKRYFGFSAWLDFKLRVHSKMNRLIQR